MQKHTNKQRQTRNKNTYLYYECHLALNSDIKIYSGQLLINSGVYLCLALFTLVILPQVSGHRLNLHYKNLQNLGEWISRPQPNDLSILSLGLRFTNLAPRERFVLPILPLGRDLCFQEYILWLYSLLDLNKP